MVLYLNSIIRPGTIDKAFLIFAERDFDDSRRDPGLRCHCPEQAATARLAADIGGGMLEDRRTSPGRGGYPYPALLPWPAGCYRRPAGRYRRREATESLGSTGQGHDAK